MCEWRETRNGNYIYEVGDGVMTVFQRMDGWHGVHDGEFTVEVYGTAEAAMHVMEAAVLEGEEGLIEAPTRIHVPSHWRLTKNGGWFRQYHGRHASVKQAKSGKWYVVDGTDLVRGQWFDTPDAAMGYADKMIFCKG